MSVGTVEESIDLQRAGAQILGSPLLARLLDVMAADLAEGGPCAELLVGASERPVHDAIPLRLLGGVHRIVLQGRAPELACWYPSAGGDPSAEGDLAAAFLTVVRRHLDELRGAMGQTVQTNEVGRATALVGGFAEVGRRSGLPLRIREIGASAGLLLRWDHFAYEPVAGAVAGDPSSPLRFEPSWWEGEPPDLSGAVVLDRRGCDLAPIDPTSPTGSLTLESFVWPDQADRLERLRAAIAVAREVPATVDCADAAEWVEEQLAERAHGVVTVVYHSIVWPYLPPPTRDRMRSALVRAGERATPDAPLAWLRMEPAGAMADVRLTLWPGGQPEVLGTCGYHGRPVQWGVAAA